MLLLNGQHLHARGPQIYFLGAEVYRPLVEFNNFATKIL